MARVLVACEWSQTVTKAFRSIGFEAYSCDVLPQDGGFPEWHIQADVLTVIDDGWDMMIAHPPCTRLANSGVRWLHERDLWGELDAAAEFFKSLLCANIPMICVENPIPHKYAVERIGESYSQIIQPYQFGHGETKATCLWLRNLPLLQPTAVVDGREQKMWRLPPSADRAKMRGKTYEGIAWAMAHQWGKLLIQAKE